MSIESFSVVEAVNQNIIAKAKVNDRNNLVFHPSEWDGCHRKIAYQYYEAQKSVKFDDAYLKIDPRGQRIFANGHYMHDRWKNDFLSIPGFTLHGKWKCSNFIAHEKPQVYGSDNSLGVVQPEKCECGCTRFEYIELGYYNEETNWGGHVDAVLKVGETDQFIVVDFKSMNPFEFKKLQQPTTKHNTQMQVYLYLSGLKLGKFIYENKADQDVKEFDVHRDDDFINVKKEEAILLKYRVQNKNSQGKRVLPQRSYVSKSHTECLRCKYRNHCWK